MIDAAGIGKVEMCSLLADVGEIEDEVPAGLMLDAEAPALLVRNLGADVTNWPVSTIADIIQQAQAAARGLGRPVGIGIAHSRSRRRPVSPERGHEVGQLVETLLPNAGGPGHRSSPS